MATPFATVKLSSFMKAIKGIDTRKPKKILQALRNRFSDEPVWQNDEDPEISFEKFFNSTIFKGKSRHKDGRLDLKLLTLFAVYTCK